MNLEFIVLQGCSLHSLYSYVLFVQNENVLQQQWQYVQLAKPLLLEEWACFAQCLWYVLSVIPPSVSSLFIVASRPHPSDFNSGHCTLTVLMESKGILAAHWLSHSVRRLGNKSLLLYLFRMTTSSICFTLMHFDNTFWYCLKLLPRILRMTNYATH